MLMRTHKATLSQLSSNPLAIKSPAAFLMTLIDSIPILAPIRNTSKLASSNISLGLTAPSRLVRWQRDSGQAPPNPMRLIVTISLCECCVHSLPSAC